MTLPQRKAGECGMDWWASLTHKQKIAEVLLLLEKYDLSSSKIRNYLDLKTRNMVVSIRACISAEINNGVKKHDYHKHPRPKQKTGFAIPAIVTLAGPKLDCIRASNTCAYLPAAGGDLSAQDIAAIASMYA